MSFAISSLGPVSPSRIEGWCGSRASKRRPSSSRSLDLMGSLGLAPCPPMMHLASAARSSHAASRQTTNADRSCCWTAWAHHRRRARGVDRTETSPVPIRPYSLLRIDPTDPGSSWPISSSTSWARLPAEVPSTHEIWLSAKTNQVISIIDAAFNARTTLGGIPISQAEAQGFGVTYLDGSVWVSGAGDQVIPISPKTHLIGLPIQLHGEMTTWPEPGEGYCGRPLTTRSACSASIRTPVTSLSTARSAPAPTGSPLGSVRCGSRTTRAARSLVSTRTPAPVTRSWSASRRRRVGVDISLQGVRGAVRLRFRERLGSRTRSYGCGLPSRSGHGDDHRHDPVRDRRGAITSAASRSRMGRCGSQVRPT